MTELLANIFYEDLPALERALAFQPSGGNWLTNAELDDLGGLDHIFIAHDNDTRNNIVARIRNEVKKSPLDESDIANGIFIATANPARLQRIVSLLKVLKEAYEQGENDLVATGCEPAGEVVVTWDETKTRILAVTRQDAEGRVLSVIAQV